MSPVKVTEVRGAYAYEGATYGPFQATEASPFVEVPAALADALGLPLHDDELKAREAAQKEADTTAEEDATALRAQLDTAKTRIAELEAEVQRLSANTTSVSVNPDALKELTDNPDTATPLPDDFPMRPLLVEGGFDTLEKVRAGLVKGEGQEKSPIENLSGIGKKSAEKIAEAVK